MDTTEATPTRRAYSYKRLSTAEQLKGHGATRQLEAAKTFCLRHGLTLDAQSFEDMGVSAYRGANAARGALRTFLLAIEDGLIEKGSVLVLENLDRMSRRAPWEALPTIQLIINSGVSIGIPMKDKIIDRELLAGPSGMFVLMEMLIDLQRAHEESETKSKRLKAAWAGKRAKAGTKLLTSLVPGWLAIQDGKPVLIEERAAVVRSIFESFVSGAGKESITRQLNQNGVKPFGRAKHWHRSYIQKMLTSPAVIGTYCPHVIEHGERGKQRVAVKDGAMAGYFPACVDETTFQRAQDMIASATNARGRHSGKAVQSLLAGLGACPKCGGTMTRVTKGARSYPYLACVAAKAAKGCTYKAVRLSVVEDVLVKDAAAWLGEAPHSDADIGDDIANHTTQLGVLDDQLEVLLDELQQRGKSAAVSGRIQKVEESREELHAELEALFERAERSASKLVRVKVQKCLDALRAEPLDKQVANAAMRTLLDRVVVDYRTGFLELHWRHGAATSLLYGMAPVTSSAK